MKKSFQGGESQGLMNTTHKSGKLRAENWLLNLATWVTARLDKSSTYR